MFQEIIEVRRLELDIFKGEHKMKKELQFRLKFLVRCLNKEYIFYAKTEMERECWIESFSKIIEINETGKGNFNLKNTGNVYLRSIEDHAPTV